MITFGQRLKEAILQEGMTQAGFARKLFVDRSWLSHVINGDKHPSFPMMQVILLNLPNTDARKLILGS